ncbi:hypothetical protein DV735_g1784, partial [Chaetothyriales sp. CBS 134920]
MELSIAPLLLALVLSLFKIPIPPTLWLSCFGFGIWTVSPQFLLDVLDLVCAPSDLVKSFLLDLSDTYARSSAKTPFSPSPWDVQLQTTDRRIRQLFLLLALGIYVLGLTPVSFITRAQRVSRAIVGSLRWVFGIPHLTESTEVNNTVEHWKGQLYQTLVDLTEKSKQHEAALQKVEEYSRTISCLRAHVDQLRRDMLNAGAPPDAYPYLQTPCFQLLPPSVSPDCIPTPCPNHEATKTARKELLEAQQQLSTVVSELALVKQTQADEMDALAQSHVDAINSLTQTHVDEIDALKKAHADKESKLMDQLSRSKDLYEVLKIEVKGLEVQFQRRIAAALEEDAAHAVAIKDEHEQLAANVLSGREELQRVTRIKDDYLEKLSQWRDYCLEQKANASQELARRDKMVEDLQAAMSESALVRQIKELEGQLVAAKAAVEEGKKEHHQFRYQLQQQFQEVQHQAQNLQQQLVRQDLASKKHIQELENRQAREKDKLLSKFGVQDDGLVEMEEIVTAGNGKGEARQGHQEEGQQPSSPVGSGAMDLD